VHDLHEIWPLADLCQRVLVGVRNGVLQALLVAFAAMGAAIRRALLILVLAGRVLANQLAFRARAGGWLLALPVALRGLAQGRAGGFRSLAGSVADGRRAHSLALRAALLLAHVFRAAHCALRLLAVHLALGAGSLLALHLALGSLADGGALCRANGIIALPAAVRVALSLGGERDGRD